MVPGESFRELVAAFLKDRNVALKQRKGSPGTLEYYTHALGRLVEWSETTKVTPREFSRRHLTDYVAYLMETGRRPGRGQKTTEGKELSASTLHSYASLVRSVLLFAEDAGYIDRAPKFPRQSAPKPAPSFLTDEQLQRALAACENARDRAIVALLADSGLRRAELCALNWGDVTFSDGLGRIFVKRGKGAKQRTSYFTPATWTVLKRYGQSRPTGADDPVFLGVSDETRLGDDGLARMLARLGKRLSFRLTPHVLRHTAARRMLARGMPWPSVQKSLGHANPGITLGLYGAFSESMTENAYRDAFNGGTNGGR